MNIRGFNFFYIMSIKKLLVKSQSIETDSLETRSELTILRSYVENQAILEPILLYQASKCKQFKEQGREGCLWTHIFTFS